MNPAVLAQMVVQEFPQTLPVHQSLVAVAVAVMVKTIQQVLVVSAVAVMVEVLELVLPELLTQVAVAVALMVVHPQDGMVALALLFSATRIHLQLRLVLA
jgi:hypothetical protein